VEPGSSISHWDVTAFPNLLMEPAINGNLSSEVDATLAHFADIGWLGLPTDVADRPDRRQLALQQNEPNPFNPSTTIRYELSRPQSIRLEVYDVQGRLVRTLLDGPSDSGSRRAKWNGRDETGRDVASGIYYVKLTGEFEQDSLKMVLLK
jgi:hypothetical protein